MTARQAFARHCRDRSFVVLGDNTRFVTVLALGSITGTILGGLLLGVIPDLVLVPVLVAVLLLSARSRSGDAGSIGAVRTHVRH